MEWLSHRLDQKDRNQNPFRRAAEHLFAELQQRMEDALQIYNRRSGRPGNEIAYIQNNIVRFGTADAAGNKTQTPGSASINLTLGSAIITADYSQGGPPVLFTIEADENGYLKLKKGNDVVSVDKATELILSGFLFS